MANSLSKISLSGAILAHQLDADLLRAIRSFSEVEYVCLGWNGQQTQTEVQTWIKKQSLTNTKVLLLPKVVDFAAARNAMLEAATTDWVLFLDSDEQLPDDADLPAAVGLLSKKSVGMIRRVDIFHGQPLKHGEVAQVWVPRLLPKGARFERVVHEDLEAGWERRQLPMVITHWSHANISQFLTKIRSYAALEAESRLAAGRHFSYWESVAFPVGKFLANYVLRLGFLDGWRGLVYAVMMSLHSAEVRVFFYEKSRSHS